MTNILIFARLTVLEASRRKVLWALVGLAALIIGLSFWGFARLPDVHAFGTQLSAANSHLTTAQLLGIVLFALSFVGALGMSFVAAPRPFAPAHGRALERRHERPRPNEPGELLL